MIDGVSDLMAYRQHRYVYACLRVFLLSKAVPSLRLSVSAVIQEFPERGYQ